jgi:peroxiredoxin
MARARRYQGREMMQALPAGSAQALPAGTAQRRAKTPALTLPLVILLIALGLLGAIIWRAMESDRLAAGRVPAAAAPADERPPAPDVSVVTLDGRRVSLAEWRGKPVVLYFMASWCASCVPEAQALAKVHQEYRAAGLEVLVLDVDPTMTEQDLTNFRRFVPGAAYHWALDRGQVVTQAFQVRSLDTTIIIDRQGRIAYRDSVPTPLQTLRQAVARVL